MTSVWALAGAVWAACGPWHPLVAYQVDQLGEKSALLLAREAEPVRVARACLPPHVREGDTVQAGRLVPAHSEAARANVARARKKVFSTARQARAPLTKPSGR